MALEEQALGMQSIKNKKVKVSILCLAYNQRKYIKKCLDGFLMQKTNFDYEVLIHDDSSTDGTEKIIKEYAAKNSNIKPIYQKANQYSKGVKITKEYQLPRVKGEFVALCEGDDYWTDENKLQKQVDFLDSNPDYALCFHPVKILFEGKGIVGEYPEPELHKKNSVLELLKQNYIQTNSVMYRRAQSYNAFSSIALPGDWYMHLYHAQFGKIGFINETMAVYRRHKGGIWWDAHNDIDSIWKNHGIGHFELYDQMLKMHGKNDANREVIGSHITDLFTNMARISEGNKDTELLTEACEKYPRLAAISIAKQRRKLLEANDTINKQNKRTKTQEDKIKSLENKVQRIINTRTVRTRNKLARKLGKEEIK